MKVLFHFRPNRVKVLLFYMLVPIGSAALNGRQTTAVIAPVFNCDLMSVLL